MTTDPMDLPEDTTPATPRELVKEVLDMVEEQIVRHRHYAQEDANRRSPNINRGLLTLLQADDETWRYVASRSAELYTQTVIQPMVQRIRTSAMAVCDLADMMAEAAEEAEDRK